MSEEEDFQKEIFNILNDHKKRIRKFEDDFTQINQQIQELNSGILQMFQWQAQLKGSECNRATGNYCTAWQFKPEALKNIPDQVKKQFFVYIGGRYHPKVATLWCYWCPRFEKRD